MEKSGMRILILTVFMFAGMNVQAATTWTGAVDDNWSTPGNWSGEVGGTSSNSWDVIIDGSDSDGTIQVDIDTSLTPLATLTITNASTNIVFSGNALYFEPALTPGNTGGGLDVIKNEDNSFVHTFNNDIVSPNDGVDNRIWINPGGSTFVFNGELSTDPTTGDTLEFRNGSVTVNNKITTDAVRIAWGGPKVISNGVDNAIGSVVSVHNAAELVVDTPAGTNFFDGYKFQHNSDADYTFNNANVIGDATRIIAGTGKTLTYRFNADEDLGDIQIPGGTFNLILGESVNTLAFDDSSGASWSGASFHITGFRTNTISFGTDNTGLTELQLEAITAEGETGGAQLDANGYLYFAGEPPLITGETIVDYEGGSNTNSRPADIQTDTGYTWNFSETEPLFIDPSGQNRTIYGGVIATWSPATNYTPEVELRNNLIWTKVEPDSVNKSRDTSLEGMFVWSKEDFLLGSGGTLSFTNGNAMVLAIQFAWAGPETRFVVKQGDTYYVSDANQTGSGTLSIDPSLVSVNWAPINTSDYTIGSYGPMTFTDIEAVGIYFNYSRTANNIFIAVNDFFVRANVYLPPPTEISDVSINMISAGSQVVVSWQGTNTASYALQMSSDLGLGTWSSVITNMAGVNDLMSVTNDTAQPEAFFRTILE